jgi:SAM-dependent methyltransferase
MTQNIYDEQRFFDAYSQLPRSVHGLDGAPEWPVLSALLPPLRGRKMLDLGCGFGWFCRWARQQGAAQILGIDVSEKMLARARATTHDPAISYLYADMETVELPPGSFELVFSSLALHYVHRLDRLMAGLRQSLVVGGSLVFSVEHPVYTAPGAPQWSVDGEGHRTWPLDRYLDEGPRTTDWLAEGVVKQHRTMASYVNLLLRLGFTLSHIDEWGPSDEQIAARPSLADERHRPPFLLAAARR